MKLLLKTILIVVISQSVFSNEVEVIDLHESKSLDQLVLDKLNNDLENDDSDINTNQLSKDIENESENNEFLDENSKEIVLIDDINLDSQKYLISFNNQEIKNFLSYSKDIKSEVLKNEFYDYLLNLKLDLSISDNKEIFFTLVDYFYKIGKISYAYDLIKFNNISNDDNISYYNFIEINYLLATYQLEEVCNFKSNNNININLDNFLFEKIDIFCLLLENKFSEADLFNALLIEVEENLDQNFQLLYSLMADRENNFNYNEVDFKFTENQNLIFLYSAMSRIAEIPLSEELLNIDPKNLAIPIILNKSTPMKLRLKAANQAYINRLITIDSLAALYQSVDFDNSQIDNFQKTLNELNNDTELSMALHFQNINVQIFPSERLSAIIQFWTFAKKHNLSKIAYSLTLKIIESIDPNSSNYEYGADIATSYIYNEFYNEASKWIKYYENNIGIDDRSNNARLLLDLHSATEYNDIVNTIDTNIDNLKNIENKNSKEFIYVLHNILEENENFQMNIDLESIYDDRLMPSIFFNENLKSSINNNELDKFLIYSIISINGKNWVNLHPEHLKILLDGFLEYENGRLMKDLILEIILNYKIL